VRENLVTRGSQSRNNILVLQFKQDCPDMNLEYKILFPDLDAPPHFVGIREPLARAIGNNSGKAGAV
jgi:hypothetical protein